MRESRNIKEGLLFCGLKIGQMASIYGRSVFALAQCLIMAITDGRGDIEWQPSRRSKKAKIAILLTGPSVNGFNRSDAGECLVVNSFANVEAYAEIRPSFYVIADPIFWLGDQQERKNIAQTIFDKTQWKLLIFLPTAAKNSLFSQMVTKNKNVSVKYYPRAQSTAAWSIQDTLLRHAIATPPRTNVLVAALCISYWLGYKQISLHGADFSFFKGIVVGQDNIVYIKNNTGATPFLCSGRRYGGVKRGSLADFFSVQAEALSSLEYLAGFFARQGLKVYNRNPNSFLDMFEKS